MANDTLLSPTAKGEIAMPFIKIIKLKQLVAIFCLVISSNTMALSLDSYMASATLKDITKDDQNYLSNTSGDGFFTIGGLDLPRGQACGLSLTLNFKEGFEKPAIFEIFWRTKKTNYSERQKAFFIINQEDSKQTKTYLVPLCKLYNFSGNLNQPVQQGNISGLRFDYPGNKKLAIKFEAIELLNSESFDKLLKNQSSEHVLLGAYERIEPRSFTSLDVIIPKLLFSFEEGLGRLTKDMAFFVFWLLLIIGLTLLIVRSFIREYRAVKQD